MIVFDNVWKYEKRRRAKVAALAGITCVFEKKGSVAILCDDSSSADLLVNLLTGTDLPDLGRISRRGRVSWPVGQFDSSKGSLTVRDNIRFIARVYGLHENSFVDYVDEAAEIGAALNKPLINLDRHTKQMVNYAVVLAIPFDWYILRDEIRGPDRPSTSLLKSAFRNRLTGASAIIVTEDAETARAYGDVGVLFRKGRFDFAESVDHAVNLHLAG